jgi:hypothetical protein
MRLGSLSPARGFDVHGELPLAYEGDDHLPGRSSGLTSRWTSFAGTQEEAAFLDVDALHSSGRYWKRTLLGHIAERTSRSPWWCHPGGPSRLVLSTDEQRAVGGDAISRASLGVRLAWSRVPTGDSQDPFSDQRFHRHTDQSASLS